MALTDTHRVAILGAARTPIGKFGGSLRTVRAVDLGCLAAQAALQRSSVPPSEVSFVVFGHCIQAGTGQNPARQVLRGCRIPDSIGASTVNMVCGSGMQALIFAAHMIRSGEFSIVLAGGMESMSSAPYLVPSAARWGLKHGSGTLDDAMMRDALLDAYGEHEQMGLTGERVAEHFHLARADVDRFGFRSHQRASSAREDGTFAREISAAEFDSPSGRVQVESDEGPRANTTLEGLSRLRPSFRPDGLLTAGNSSQLADGAAALVLASEAEAKRRGVTPLAWLASTMVSGVAPSDVMEAPIPTVRAQLEATGLAPADLDRVEHNEAFSSASLAVQKTFGFTEEQFNVHGGAVALGHPIGASGARIVVTLLNELAHQDLRRGLATLCMGGGNGLSLLLDRNEARGRHDISRPLIG